MRLREQLLRMHAPDADVDADAAPSSTMLQASGVHGGLTDDPAAMLEHLFATLVIAGPAEA